MTRCRRPITGEPASIYLRGDQSQGRQRVYTCPGPKFRQPLTPGNPGCSHRWYLAFWAFVPLVYCTTRLEDASGILHFIVSVFKAHKAYYT